jgi:hypothetical protein
MQNTKTTALIALATATIMAGIFGCSTDNSRSTGNSANFRPAAQPNPTPSTITQRGTLLPNSYYDSNNQVGR